MWRLILSNLIWPSVFAILFGFLNETPILNNGPDESQWWKSLFKKLGDDRIKQNWRFACLGVLSILQLAIAAVLEQQWNLKRF